MIDTKELDQLRAADAELGALCERLHAVLGDYASPGEHYADAAARLLRERDQLEDNLTAMQRRCSELLDEARANRRIANAPPGELVALSHFSFERRRQDLKWGPLEKQIAVPNGTGLTEAQTLDRDVAQMVCDDAFACGDGTWADVLREEVAEALAESDPKRLRQELIEVGGVACKWVEILDRRANVNPLPATGGIPLPGWTCTATRLVTDGETTRQACCRTFNGANPKWLEQCRSCGSHGPAEPKPVATPARLDADRTATGKTILTSRIRRGGEGTMFVQPGEFHIDTMTGKRTPLGPEKT